VNAVKGDVSKRQILFKIFIRLDVTTSFFDTHLNLEFAAFANGGNMNIRIKNIHIGIRREIRRSHHTRLINFKIYRLGMI
jgi:hypothetical protein